MGDDGQGRRTCATLSQVIASIFIMLTHVGIRVDLSNRRCIPGVYRMVKSALFIQVSSCLEPIFGPGLSVT
jgi:hypothetical protein